MHAHGDVKIACGFACCGPAIDIAKNKADARSEDTADSLYRSAAQSNLRMDATL
jgi:hypothetical protein